MKATFTFFIMSFLIMGFTSQSQSQDIKEAIALVADGIKPEAFKGKWAKTRDAWKSDLEKLDPTDMDGLTSSISGLTKSLKGSAFTEGDRKEMLASLMGDGTKNVGTLLASLVSSLKPEMLTDALRQGKEKMLGGLKDAK